jgi:hypothetical protein
MAEKSDYGITTIGESINWKSIDGERITDPIISSLMKEAEKLYMVEEYKSNTTSDKNVDIINFSDIKALIKKMNEYLILNKYSPIFEEESKIEKASSKKGDKSKKLSKKDEIREQIRLENLQKNINNFLKNLVIENHTIMTSQSNNFIEILFKIIYWAIYLIKKRKTEIDISVYLDCVISLYRIIEKIKPKSDNEVNTDFNNIIEKSSELLNKLEEIIEKKIGKQSFFSIISENSNLISNSFLDINEPNFISLYDEQKLVITYILNAVKNDESLLLFYKVPPANGKTLISTIISKIIGNFNKTASKKKTLLYICYNSIVRNEVAKLCIAHNVDVKFWLAITKMDKYDGKIKTFVRPYKNCYPDWNKRVFLTEKQKKEQQEKNKAKFSENIHDQWEFFLRETRPLKYKNTEIENYDEAELPEMIIADLESAVKILEEFGDVVIPYFDEAFAASNLPITAKILSILPKVSILVSATLADPEEIPIVINDFKLRHNIISNDNIKVVKSDTQHISCTFIDPNGCIYAPNYSSKTIEELGELLKLFKNEPLIQRAYSLDVVFSIASILVNDLESSLQFREYFKYIGSITHTKLRWYAFSILEYIKNNNRIDLLEKINSKSEKIIKMNFLETSDILTKNAVFYQSGKTLHIAASDIFNSHLVNIATPFLEGSPKIDTIIRDYCREKESLEGELKNLERNGSKESEEDRYELSNNISNVRIKWPSEFIINSVAHSKKFGTLGKLKQQNCEIFGNIEETNILSEIIAKLFISGIGVYQPEDFSNVQMDLFLRNKDRFKFILSTPSIVYGTNISLSIIDIDKSFADNASKNTLYQLAGRAGRSGRSNSAIIIFRDWKMIELILQKDILNIEAKQIEDNYGNISK